MGIEQYSLGDYLQLEQTNEIDVLIGCVKPNPIIRYKGVEVKPKKESLWMLEWGQLIELRELTEEKMFDTINITHGIKLGALVLVSALNVFACFEWIGQELKQIADAESQHIYSKPTVKETNAGIEKFEQFGYANSLRAIRGTDVTKDEELLKLPYAVIFRELAMNRVSSEYQEAYAKQR